MTSNIGVRRLKEFGTGMGFATQAKEESSDNETKGVIETALKRTFSPEFLNRIDDVIIFNSLGKEEIYKIIDITLKNLYKRVNDLGYNLVLDEKAKNFLAEKGYDPQFGARPLNRAIQKYLEDPLAEFILNNQALLTDGTTMSASLDEKDNIIITIIDTDKKTKKSK
jgi:ATP-dependent Clp protease ATP-binding subunit ClpC